MPKVSFIGRSDDLWMNLLFLFCFQQSSELLLEAYSESGISDRAKDYLHFKNGVQV